MDSSKHGGLKEQGKYPPPAVANSWKSKQSQSRITSQIMITKGQLVSAKVKLHRLSICKTGWQAANSPLPTLDAALLTVTCTVPLRVENRRPALLFHPCRSWLKLSTPDTMEQSDSSYPHWRQHCTPGLECTCKKNYHKTNFEATKTIKWRTRERLKWQTEFTCTLYMYIKTFCFILII